jgi:hypothetical protein
MSVHQLKDGRWIVCYRNGEKKLREYFGRGIDAEQQAIARNAELNLNEYHRKTDPRRQVCPTFSALASAYLESRAVHMQPSTLSSLLYKLTSVVSPKIGHLLASQVTPYRMDQYVAKRIRDGKTKSTVHRDLTDIMAILNWGVKRGILLRNPLMGYEKPKRDDEVIMPPTPEEARRIIAHALSGGGILR